MNGHCFDGCAGGPNAKEAPRVCHRKGNITWDLFVESAAVVLHKTLSIKPKLADDVHNLSRSPTRTLLRKLGVV